MCAQHTGIQSSGTQPRLLCPPPLGQRSWVPEAESVPRAAPHKELQRAALFAGADRPVKNPMRPLRLAPRRSLPPLDHNPREALIFSISWVTSDASVTFPAGMTPLFSKSSNHGAA